MAPNSTATWVDAGADISNLWIAVRDHVVALWSQDNTFQWIWYSINKTADGVRSYTGEFQVQIQTPTFVNGLRYVLWRRLRSQYMYLLG